MPAKKKPANKFIQDMDIKKGALRRKLKVPEGYSMGDMMTFLHKILETPGGHVCKNPLVHGISQIKVDETLKKEVRLAIRLMAMPHKKKGGKK
jgi:hypothetical protein